MMYASAIPRLRIIATVRMVFMSGPPRVGADQHEGDEAEHDHCADES